MRSLISLTTLTLCLAAVCGKFVNVKLNHDDASEFQLEIPRSSLNKPFLTHAIFHKGSMVRGKVGRQELIRSWDVEGVYDLAFHFEASEDGRFIYHVHEQHNIQTTDKQMEYAFAQGTFTGRRNHLPILQTTSNSVTVDARALILSGFGVAYDVLLGESYELSFDETQAFEKNFNVVVKYDSIKLKETYPTSFAVFFSIMALPEVPMTPRVVDDRIGYLFSQCTDLGLHHGVFKGAKKEHPARDIDPVYHFINRRNLEVDAENNVVNPIIFYIDYSVPEIWRPYFKEGVELWNEAFEKAGLKNAIYAVLPGDQEWPSDYQVGDLRFNTVSYSVYTGYGATAYGPSVVDLRSGEIIASNIVFSSSRTKFWLNQLHGEMPDNSILFQNKYDSMSLRPNCLHQHVFDQMENLELFGMINGGNIPKEVIGAGYRHVMAHEVGHTLGLQHNFIGSLEFSPEELKDPDFTKVHGLTSTVMEYSPLNLWSDMSPDDLERNTWFNERVGSYDIAAIEYGYKKLDGEQFGVKHPELYEIAARAPSFAADAESSLNMGPYVVIRDLSSDPAAFHIDRIKLVRKVLPTLVNRTIKNKDGLGHVYPGLVRLLTVLDVAGLGLGRYIGGARTYHSHRDIKNPDGNGMTYISKHEQLRAIEAVLDIIAGEGLLPDPTHYADFVDIDVKDAPYAVFPAKVDEIITVVISKAFGYIIGAKTLKRVVEKGAGATLSVADILKLVTKKIWTLDAYVLKHLKLYSLHLQALARLANDSEIRLSSVAMAELASIKAMLVKWKTESCDMFSEQPNCFSAFSLLKQIERM